MKSAQYNAGLAITGAISSAFRERLYQELGLESSVKDDGIENFATFSKYLRVNSRSIFSKYLF